jgi:transcriptional regulator with XRE-family HTH domain
VTPRRKEQLGDRVRRYREDKGLTLTQLADLAGVSKGYLSSLENDPDDKRPSAQTLYALANALGVAMSDLLGEKLIIEPDSDVPKSLRDFADAENLPEADVQMLATIRFRGDRPQTAGRWRHIYEAIKMSRSLDA